MRTILLPEWNDLTNEIRMELVRAGEFWDQDYGADIALSIYKLLRAMLAETYFDPEVEPRLFADEPNVLRRSKTDGI